MEEILKLLKTLPTMQFCKSITFFDLSDFYSRCGNLYHPLYKIAVQSKLCGKF